MALFSEKVDKDIKARLAARLLVDNLVETRHLITGRSLKSLDKESGVSLSGGTLPL